MPAGSGVGQAYETGSRYNTRYYFSGSFNVFQTDSQQVLSANNPATVVQNIDDQTTLTDTSDTLWSEKMASSTATVSPDTGVMLVAGNSGTSGDKLTLDTDTSNDPQYICIYRFATESVQAITDAQIEIDVPDGIDATGIKLPVGKGREIYLPGTTSYQYTFTLADGSIETGTANADIIVSRTGSSPIRKIILVPNYLAPGAGHNLADNSVSTSLYLIGTLVSNYDNGSNVEVGDK